MSASNATTLAVLDGISDEMRDHDSAIGTQVAFIRALLDEVQRRRSLDVGTSALSEQLTEEMGRLERMLLNRASEPPHSGVHPTKSPSSND